MVVVCYSVGDDEEFLIEAACIDSWAVLLLKRYEDFIPVVLCPLKVVVAHPAIRAGTAEVVHDAAGTRKVVRYCPSRTIEGLRWTERGSKEEGSKVCLRDVCSHVVNGISGFLRRCSRARKG